jgi:hypothetical protein
MSLKIDVEKIFPGLPFNGPGLDFGQVDPPFGKRFEGGIEGTGPVGN